MNRADCLSLDPVDALLAAEVATDHAQAKVRGARLLRVANRVIDEMQARGVLRASADDVRGTIFHALADEFYGNAAIDVPPLRGGRT